MNLPINYKNASQLERKAAREEYIKVQNGRCCHCGRDLNQKPDPQILEMKVDRTLFPPNFFKNPIHLHHSHETDMTIGAVHAYCNAVLWQYFGE